MIEIRGLKKSFENKDVLKGIELDIKKGEVMVIIGGSGSGKSVLLKHIIGLLGPDEGSVYVDGFNIVEATQAELDEVRKKFGMVFQGSALFDSLTILDNVAFAMKRYTNMTDDEIRQVVKEKLAMVGLYGIEDLKPAQLSGGMKKRVGIARAIAMNPMYLLYDEPTTGLDPIMADVINDLIIKLNRMLSVTSVVVTHDMQSAYKIADRIAMIYDGVIIECDTVNKIKRTKNPYVRQFITGSAKGPITDELERVYAHFQ